MRGEAEPLWEDYQDTEYDRLQDDKGNHAIVYIRSLHLGWCDPFQVEETEAEGRCEERSLQVHGHKDGITMQRINSTIKGLTYDSIRY